MQKTKKIPTPLVTWVNMNYGTGNTSKSCHIVNSVLETPMCMFWVFSALFVHFPEYFKFFYLAEYLTRHKKFYMCQHNDVMGLCKILFCQSCCRISFCTSSGTVTYTVSVWYLMWEFRYIGWPWRGFFFFNKKICLSRKGHRILCFTPYSSSYSSTAPDNLVLCHSRSNHFQMWHLRE